MIETEEDARADMPVCLVLMFKAPARSKRRLAREIGALATAAAERLFACAVEDMRAWPGPIRFAPAGAEDAQWLESRLGTGQPVVMQGGGNLGDRIATVDAALAAEGLERQMLVGVDCPTLGPTHLARAALALSDNDAALAPAVDGGTVLMATRRRWPPLADLPWSEPTLLEALVARCSASGWRVQLTETLADVDTAADLRASLAALVGDERPCRRELRGWIDAHADRLWQTAS